MAINDPELTIRAQDKTATAFKSVRSRMGDFRKEVFSARTALVALTGAAGFGAFIKVQIDAADKVGKLSTKLGISTEALSQYQHVANLSGISFDQLTMAMQRMTRRTAEAAQGTGEAQGALRELNLDAAELAGLAPENQFEVIADRLAGVTNQSDRLRLAFKLFDSEGVTVLQTMKNGAAGIREMREEADRLGLTLSRDQVDAAEKAKNEITRLEGAFTGLTRSLALEFAPTISGVINKLSIGIPNAVDTAGSAIQSLYDFLSPSGINAGPDRADLTERIDALQKMIAYYDQIGTAAPAHLTRELEERENQLAKITRMQEAIESWRRPDRGAVDESGAMAGLGIGGADVAKDQLKALEDFGFEDLKVRQHFLDMRRHQRTQADQAEFDALYAFEDAKTATARAGNLERLQILRQSSRQQADFAIGEAIRMTRGVSQESRALFEINKAASIAQIALKTPEAIANAYSWGAALGGPPGGAAAAALAAAAQAAQASAVLGVSFGGGGASGGAPSNAPSGGTPSNPVFQEPTTPPPGPREINVTIDVHGSGKLDRDQSMEIARSLNELIRDGVELTFS